MPKRKSEEPPDVSADTISLSHKKVRIDDILDEAPILNGKSAFNGEEPQDGVGNGTGLSGSGPKEEAHQDEGAASNEDEDPGSVAPLRQNAPTEGYSDLYLDSINRSVLDFDFEKLCSVTLSNINVCLFGMRQILSRKGTEITCLLPCLGNWSSRLHQYGHKASLCTARGI